MINVNRKQLAQATFYASAGVAGGLVHWFAGSLIATADLGPSQAFIIYSLALGLLALGALAPVQLLVKPARTWMTIAVVIAMLVATAITAPVIKSHLSPDPQHKTEFLL